MKAKTKAEYLKKQARRNALHERKSLSKSGEPDVFTSAIAAPRLPFAVFANAFGGSVRPDLFDEPLEGDDEC